MTSPQPGPFTYEPLPRRPLKPAIAMCFIVVGAVLGGYGIGCNVIDLNGHGPPAYVAEEVPGLAAAIGFCLAVIGLLSWSFVVAPWPIELNFWYGVGMLALAAAGGQLVAAAELEVGGWYLVVAGATAAAGVIVLNLAFLVSAWRGRRYARDLALMAGGTPRSATVLDSGLDPGDFEEVGNVITSVLFRFVGADDTAYQLRRTITIPVRAPIEEGHETVVWHDPERPLDEAAMVVAIQHALRWNVAVPAPTVTTSYEAVAIAHDSYDAPRDVIRDGTDGDRSG